MRWFPPMPEGNQGSGELRLRYEDVTQDGRLTLDCLPTAIGHIAWPRLMADLGERASQPSDVVPILTRMVVESQQGPVSVMQPLSGRGAYAAAHSRGANDEVDRIYINMWAELSGVIGNTHGFWVDRAGESIPVGQVFAEHVLTRPFAPPDERKVTTLDVPGFPPIPPEIYAWRSPEVLLGDVPAEVAWLDEDMHAEHTSIVFGLVHTDSNQHVNSLVYPRLFEEAALRRLQAHGITKVLGRYAEMSYRKPSFAGDVVQVHLQAGRVGESHVVRGYFAAPAEPRAKARAYGRMILGD